MGWVVDKNVLDGIFKRNFCFSIFFQQCKCIYVLLLSSKISLKKSFEIAIFFSTASHDISAVYSVENIRVSSIMKLTMLYCV